MKWSHGFYLGLFMWPYQGELINDDIVVHIVYLTPSQREVEDSYASNADYVHKSVLFTEEGRKRYAEQVT